MPSLFDYEFASSFVIKLLYCDSFDGIHREFYVAVRFNYVQHSSLLYGTCNRLYRQRPDLILHAYLVPSTLFAFSYTHHLRVSWKWPSIFTRKQTNDPENIVNKVGHHNLEVPPHAIYCFSLSILHTRTNASAQMQKYRIESKKYWTT